MDATTEFLTVDEVAQRLRYKPATIQGWLRTGRLHGTKVGREWRIAAREVEALFRHSPDRPL